MLTEDDLKRANPKATQTVNIIGFVVALIALQAKLERVPFDAPEAETEIVAGALTEYSGKKLALFRLTVDMELVAGSALIAAIFLGGAHPVQNFAAPAFDGAERAESAARATSGGHRAGQPTRRG